jgi:hypothetical protein
VRYTTKAFSYAFKVLAMRGKFLLAVPHVVFSPFAKRGVLEGDPPVPPFLVSIPSGYRVIRVSAELGPHKRSIYHEATCPLYIYDRLGPISAELGPNKRSDRLTSHMISHNLTFSVVPVTHLPNVMYVKKKGTNFFLPTRP